MNSRVSHPRELPAFRGLLSPGEKLGRGFASVTREYGVEEVQEAQTKRKRTEEDVDHYGDRGMPAWGDKTEGSEGIRQTEG